MFDVHAKESDPNSVLLVICHSHLLGICYSCRYWSRLWCTRFTLSPHLKTLEILSQLAYKEPLTTKTSTAHKQNLEVQEPEEAYLSKIIQKLIKIIKIETYHLFHTTKMKRSNSHQGLQCKNPLPPPKTTTKKKQMLFCSFCSNEEKRVLTFWNQLYELSSILEFQKYTTC